MVGVWVGRGWVFWTWGLGVGGGPTIFVSVYRGGSKIVGPPLGPANRQWAPLRWGCVCAARLARPNRMCANAHRLDSTMCGLSPPTHCRQHEWDVIVAADITPIERCRTLPSSPLARAGDPRAWTGPGRPLAPPMCAAMALALPPVAGVAFAVRSFRGR